jgi:hypothetical protein
MVEYHAPIVVGVHRRAGAERRSPKLTTTSRSPSPVFVLLRGFEPSAVVPSGNVPSTATSRTDPWTITPAHPFDTGNPATTRR